jgi:hypothetical protein
VKTIRTVEEVKMKWNKLVIVMFIVYLMCWVERKRKRMKLELEWWEKLTNMD